MVPKWCSGRFFAISHRKIITREEIKKSLRMRRNSVVKCGNIRKFKTTFYALFPSKCGRRVTARESSNLSISATSEQAKMLAPTLFSQNDTGIRFAAAFLYIGLVCAHLHSFENTVYCNIQPFSLTGSHFRDGERGIQCPLPEKSILPGWQAAVWSLSCASCCGHTDGTLSRCWTG